METPRQSQAYTAEELERIDRARKQMGNIPRSSFIKAAVAEYLKRFDT